MVFMLLMTLGTQVQQVCNTSNYVVYAIDLLSQQNSVCIYTVLNLTKFHRKIHSKYLHDMKQSVTMCCGSTPHNPFSSKTCEHTEIRR